ncbi:MAG: signal peptidase II [Proteobacteria bacterium]|nr:signal peptidase II [Pseudomonadota bacterium]
MVKRNSLFFITIFLVFFADQISKHIIKKIFLPGQVLKVFPFLNLTFVENKGIAFGILHRGGDLKHLIILIFTVLAIGLLFYLFYSSEKFLVKRAIIFGFIAGGAIGNLYDRVFYGAVVDFIELYYKSFHWPVFNIADTFITIGIVLIFFFQIIRKEHIL